MNESLSLSRFVGSGQLTSWFVLTILGPALCAFSGFHTASYLLAGLYTWPRTSRILVLTVGTVIFSYEFIFRQNGATGNSGKHLSSKKWVLYSCLIPYSLGVMALIIRASLAT